MSFCHPDKNADVISTKERLILMLNHCNRCLKFEFRRFLKSCVVFILKWGSHSSYIHTRIDLGCLSVATQYYTADEESMSPLPNPLIWDFSYLRATRFRTFGEQAPKHPLQHCQLTDNSLFLAVVFLKRKNTYLSLASLD